jgi:hypothetical protein
LIPGTLISAGSSAVEMIRGVQDVQARVEGHRFAAAGGARDQDHPVRLGQVLEIELFLVLLVTERIDAELGARRVE